MDAFYDFEVPAYCLVAAVGSLLVLFEAYGRFGGKFSEPMYRE